MIFFLLNALSSPCFSLTRFVLLLKTTSISCVVCGYKENVFITTNLLNGTYFFSAFTFISIKFRCFLRISFPCSILLRIANRRVSFEKPTIASVRRVDGYIFLHNARRRFSYSLFIVSRCNNTFHGLVILVFFIKLTDCLSCLRANCLHSLIVR